MTFYGLLWAAGGNDIIGITFSLSINQITYFMRVAVFVLPVVAFLVTRRWCISLQRHDRDRLLHGYESGVIMRSADGGYSERHLPLSPDRAFALSAREPDPEPLGDDDTDHNGLRVPGRNSTRRLRRRLHDLVHADNVAPPTREELEAGREHAEHDHELRPGGR